MVSNMRLTKRQLKRIIKEEYTKLKRRGLIREMAGGDTTIVFEDFATGGEIACSVPGGVIMEIEDALERMDMGDEMGYDMLMDVMDGVFEMCQEQAFDNGAEEGVGAVISCGHPTLERAIELSKDSDRYDSGGY